MRNCPYALTSVEKLREGDFESDDYKYGETGNLFRHGYVQGPQKSPTGQRTGRVGTMTEYLQLRIYKKFKEWKQNDNRRIKQAAKDFSNKAGHVDNCERLGYEGLIDEAKADETAALADWLKGLTKPEWR